MVLHHSPHGVHEELVENVEEMEGYEVSSGVPLARLVLDAHVVVDSDPGSCYVDALSVDGGLVDSVAMGPTNS